MSYNYKNTDCNCSDCCDSHTGSYNKSLARPYVKRQVYDELYRFSLALSLGTIFPELDLWDSDLYNKDQYITPNKYYGGCCNGK